MSGPDWYRWYPTKWLAGTLGLTNEQRGVYIQIINVILDRGSCPVDEGYLMRLCNCHRRQLRRILNELLAIGKITQNGANFEQTRAKLERNNAETFVEVQRNRALKRWHGNELADANHGISQPQPQPHKKESCPNGAAKPDLSAGFDSWWLLWTIPGTKRGKGQALKAYRAARKKTEAHVLETALAQHVKRWIRDGTEPQYIPHPASWLNGERWDDDIGAPPAERPRKRITNDDLLNYTGEDYPK